MSSPEVVAPDGEPGSISIDEQTTASADRPPVALVTGAAQRLGAATARHLHAAGYTLAIHYHRSTAEARALALELNTRRPESAFTLAQDLADPLAGRALVESLMDKASHLDLLVNNASIFEGTSLASCDVESWERTQAINLRTPYFLSVEAAPLLRESTGSIVNIGDIHAHHPRRDYSIYCISKAGLVAATRALALELAPEIRVNCVAPGAIVWAASEGAQLQARALAAIPMQRCGDPTDIAEAVHYLATARYVTGHVIDVDGGRGLHV